MTDRERTSSFGPLTRGPRLPRRALLFAGVAVLAGGLAPRLGHAVGADVQRLELAARPATFPLIGGQYPDTAVWAYSDTVPGPTIRARQGERLRIAVANGLDQDTTVHWHGLRVPNAMDGVPHLTQDPIAPGESFLYEFDLPDAGTYWYHPHFGSPEQVGRGLYGALIVEEPNPPAVDRELVWVMDDWRLDQQAQITDDFSDWHDLSHAGRLGNSVTVNGRLPQDVAVRAGERIRLRLINAANARIFALEFRDHDPWVIALDGQPAVPHRPPGHRVVIAPSQRVDLILDMTGAPGSSAQVIDSQYQRDVYRFLDLVYSEEAALRAEPLDPPEALPANPLSSPVPGRCSRHKIEFGGGAMDPKLRRGEVTVEEVRSRVDGGGMWTVNGAAQLTHMESPILTLQRDEHCLLELVNDTMWFHPIHLHGHAFQLLTRNGAALPEPLWYDTILMSPGESMEIAFVADNPGDWMFHCHILEHQVSGMMATIRVA